MGNNELKLVSLAKIPAGKRCTLMQWGALSEEDIRRINDVGIVLGTPLAVQEVTTSGPLVLTFESNRVAIGISTAERLMVLPDEAERNAEPGE